MTFPLLDKPPAVISHDHYHADSNAPGIRYLVQKTAASPFTGAPTQSRSHFHDNEGV